MPILEDVLQLGSGNKYCVDAVNVDLIASTNPDIVHNLENFPWPLPSNQFKEVRAFDVVEHLNDIVKTLEEIHRVCVNGAVVKITVPHFSCVNAFTDPTHKHYFSSASFNYFTGDNEFGFYTKCRFIKKSANIIFQQTLTNKIICRLANYYPSIYEGRYAWIFPAWFLYFELIVEK